MARTMGKEMLFGFETPIMVATIIENSISSFPDETIIHKKMLAFADYPRYGSNCDDAKAYGHLECEVSSRTRLSMGPST